VLFKVMHNQAAWFYGRFGAISGTFQHSDDPAQCSLEVEVRTDSVDTRNEKLDQHLRSPDFFDAKQFPTVRFESTKVEEASEGLYRVTGDLSLHGVTKSVTIDVEHVGGSESERGEVIGFHSTFVVDRTEYGMTYGVGGPLGSEVELIVSIEAGAR
jgi:polyisoprenoid-binding protein YceI